MKLFILLVLATISLNVFALESQQKMAKKFFQLCEEGKEKVFKPYVIKNTGCYLNAMPYLKKWVEAGGNLDFITKDEFNYDDYFVMIFFSSQREYQSLTGSGTKEEKLLHINWDKWLINELTKDAPGFWERPDLDLPNYYHQFTRLLFDWYRPLAAVDAGADVNFSLKSECKKISNGKEICRYYSNPFQFSEKRHWNDIWDGWTFKELLKRGLDPYSEKINCLVYWSFWGEKAKIIRDYFNDPDYRGPECRL